MINMVSDIFAPVEADFERANALILNQLHSRVPLVETIGKYIVESGGKRMRPLLVLLISRALQATSAELGVVIPPSIPMILYGVSAEVSIGELFIAGIGPGLFIGVALMIFAVVYARMKGST